MNKYSVVLSTVPDVKTGQRIARKLVEQRLAACVTISDLRESIYWWEGNIEQEQEHLLIIKTKKSLYSKLEGEILNLHPYDVPEIIALPVAAGNVKYLEWLSSETASDLE
jgi:periplasmic divalent cation tolerance protein